MGVFINYNIAINSINEVEYKTLTKIIKYIKSLKIDFKTSEKGGDIVKDDDVKYDEGIKDFLDKLQEKFPKVKFILYETGNVGDIGITKYTNNPYSKEYIEYEEQMSKYFTDVDNADEYEDLLLEFIDHYITKLILDEGYIDITNFVSKKK